MNFMKFFPLLDSVIIAILWTGDSHMDFMIIEMWYLAKIIRFYNVDHYMKQVIPNSEFVVELITTTGLLHLCVEPHECPW